VLSPQKQPSHMAEVPAVGGPGVKRLVMVKAARQELPVSICETRGRSARGDLVRTPELRHLGPAADRSRGGVGCDY